MPFKFIKTSTAAAIITIIVSTYTCADNTSLDNPADSITKEHSDKSLILVSNLNNQLSLEDKVDLLVAGELAAKIALESHIEKKDSTPWQPPTFKESIVWLKQASKTFWQTRGKCMSIFWAAGSASIGLGCLLMNLATPQTETNLYELTQVLPQHLLYNMPKCAAASFFLTFCHEAGHALARYWIDGKPQPVRIGSSTVTLEEPLTILPYVELNGLNFSSGNTPNELPQTTNLKTEFTIKKSILLQMAQANPGNSVEEIKESSEYKEKINAALNYQVRKEHGIFHLAGPAAGLCGNTVIKIASGQSLLNIDANDVAQLADLYPATTPTNNPTDGSNFMTETLQLHKVVATAKTYQSKIFGLIATSFIIKEYIQAGICEYLPPSSISDYLALAGTTLRLAGITAINLAWAGFGSITKIIPEPLNS